MRISKERVATLSHLIVENLIEDGLIERPSKKELLMAKVESTILEELQVEDRLNAEVQKIMKSREKEMAAGGVDDQKMFQMIKRQLVKQRNLIL